MERRRWIPALVPALAACLLAGCLHGPPAQAVREGLGPPAGNADQAGPAAAPPPPTGSDYHAHLPAPAPADSKPDPGAVEQVRHDVRATSPVPERPAAPPPPPAAPPPPPDAPPVAALRCLLEHHPAQATRLLERYGKSDQEVLLALLKLAAPVGEGRLEHASPAEVAALLEQLDALAEALRPRAPLTLHNLCFYRSVTSFGMYEPLPPQECRFQAGSNGQPGELLQVYVEVRNFSSRPRPTGRAGGPCYETSLGCGLEIFECGDPSRSPVRVPIDPLVDQSKSLRHDCFIRFQFAVPAGLRPGLHTLRVTVEDNNTAAGPGGGRRGARASLDFYVTAGPPGGPPADGGPARRAEGNGE